MPVAENSTLPRIEIGRPRRFTAGALLALYACCSLLFIPMVLAMLAISMSKPGHSSWLIPVGTIILTIVFLPVGNGNAFIRWLVRCQPKDATSGDSFVVQLTIVPRIRTGLRALAEDADDVGRLTLGKDCLEFAGDSVSLKIPYPTISRVQPINIGWRGLYLCGPRISITASNLPNVIALEFTERSSIMLSESRRIAHKMYDRISNAAASKG